MSLDETAAKPPKGRLVAGTSVFALGWVATLVMVPLLTRASLPASVVGMVVFVGPKIGALAAIAIMGKPGFAYLKTLVLGYLKPPAEVGPARHRIGVVMLVAALLFGILEPYALRTTHVTGVRYVLAVDLLLVASIFVLGGNFWDKVRSLFIREAKACFPARARARA
jgi:hypothetical protein